jgi:hypothetical protein
MRLFDTVAGEVRRVVDALAEEGFAVTPGWSDEEFRKRIPAFDELLANLCRVEALIGRWGSTGSTEALSLPVKRLCDRLATGTGNSGWLELQWYPVLVLLYVGGIAAVAFGRYDALRALLHAPVRVLGNDQALVPAVTEGLSDRTVPFRLLPKLERHHTPCSDHLYDVLKPALDDLLFLGSEYERAFDTFEVLYALEYMHQTNREWGPVGQFGWKGRRGDSSPLLRTVKGAKAAGAGWPPLMAGLCGGSIERFEVISKKLIGCVARTARW